MDSQLDSFQYRNATLSNEYIDTNGMLHVKNSRVVILSEKPDRNNLLQVCKRGNYLATSLIPVSYLNVAGK